ncbi:MAG: SDR family NAD(P)-dependent oxidoreductase [Acetobacteraceae bacterium]
MTVISDPADPVEIETLCQMLCARYDVPVDILMNNAGIQHVAPLEEYPSEEWDAMLAINLSAASRDEVIHKVSLTEHPSKRFAIIEEVAAAPAFVCVALAASITGITLPLDGGWTAH